jgi:hypothetical protein
MHISERPAFGRAGPLIQLAKVAKFPLLLVVGYLLASMTANTEIQDAFQYRLNLEQGVYNREESQGYFGRFVVWINDLLPAFDPFLVVGALTAATYLFVSLKAKTPKLKYVMFLLLLVMPLISANYTQVLRQGLASAFILVGLTAGSTFLFAAFLIAGAMVHKVFAPVVAILLIREFRFRKKKGAPPPPPHERRPRREALFDLIVFVMIPVGWILVFMFGGDLFRSETYIAFDFSNAKRVVVSVLLLICVRLVYPSLNSRLSTFMAYVTISIAFILPIAIDFLRLHTVAVPFIAIAALSSGGGKNGYYALAICLLLSAYVMPFFGLHRIF